MALKTAGIEWEHREVVLRDKPQAMLDASPKGTVPVLVLADQVIDESLDVMRWALSQNDPEGWLDGDVAEMAELLETNDGPFKHHLDRYKYASRYDDNVARGQVDLSHRAKAFELLAPLEKRLSKTEFLMGERRKWVDIAIFPFIRQFAAVEPEEFSAQFPHMRRWLTGLVESELFKSIMRKYKPWSPQSAD